MSWEDLFWIHFAATAYLCGLIWIVQMNLYPAFHFVAKERFIEFHKMHSNRITWVVGPAMLLELGSAVGLAMMKLNTLLICNLGLVGIIWVCTAFVSVPIHTKLQSGQDHSLINRLVNTNWLRTAAWSGRLLLLTFAF